MNKINDYLIALNPEFSELTAPIEKRCHELKEKVNKSNKLFDQNQTVLITYADQFSSPDKTPLRTLASFIKEDLQGCVSHVHILPFYPWTSDDGFSPINYHEVKSEYGSWEDIEKLPVGKMFDCVFNHLSSESELFQKALKGDEQAKQMFHIFTEQEKLDLKLDECEHDIVRPRISPLFSEYEIQGKKHYVWTTFSRDQIDTNLNNKQMLQYLLECFFLYMEKGASFFRVDAVPFLWKELGTNCSHLPKTHVFVKLLRAIIEKVDANMLLITESNVPHSENITYWGDGQDEAHIIYNFSLAPLILHGLTFGSTKYINQWAQRVFDIGPKVSFLNFTATHDGIGMRGLEGLVPESDVEVMCERTVKNGGQIGKKRSRDGTEKPYELNITWASYLEEAGLDEASYLNKVINSHAIAMFFPGIGAHYVHNFLGTKNWQQGYTQTKHPRTLNRQKFEYPFVYNDFSGQVLARLKELIIYKNSHNVFHPKAGFKIKELNDNVLCFERFDEQDKILVFFNLTSTPQQLSYEGKELSLAPFELLFL